MEPDIQTHGGIFHVVILTHPPAFENNSYYIWLNRDTPVRAYKISEPFTQQYLLHEYKENVNETDAVQAYGIYTDAEKRTV